MRNSDVRKPIGVFLLSILSVLLVSGCSDRSDLSSGVGATEAEQKYRWRLVTSWPPNLPVNHEGVAKFMKHHTAKYGRNQRHARERSHHRQALIHVEPEQADQHDQERPVGKNTDTADRSDT